MDLSATGLRDALFWSRLQFGFTITYHYLFPQLTIGLAPFLVLLHWRAWRHPDPETRARTHAVARFLALLFGINFAVGVVTGIPMEFQFGTNWARFSAYAGGVIGQSLAMEGMFAFLLESAFVGLLVFGTRLTPRAQWACALAVFLGSWLSGYFILVTNAFMQHPVGYRVTEAGTLVIDRMRDYLCNPWAGVMYLHNMSAGVVTAAFVMAAIGAFWALSGRWLAEARLLLRWGVVGGLLSALVVAWPTGDQQAKAIARHQPVTLAAMEGRFASGPAAAIHLLGQPDVAAQRLDNPISLPGALSYLATGSFHAPVPGLDAFPQAVWPTNIELLYYAFHIMVGLGTLFILLMAAACLQLWRGRLLASRRLLWLLLLAAPFPYIATSAGWMTAELGRQPWLIYGLFRTTAGTSPQVHAGSVVFTLMGFCGLYALVGMVFLVLVLRRILHGPEPGPLHPHEEVVTAQTAPAPREGDHG